MRFKNKNTIIKNKNTRCEKKMWIYYYYIKFTNMNMKKTWQGYGAKLCLRLMLKKLKEMRGSTFIYTHVGT
jgi:hypothetical protein